MNLYLNLNFVFIAGAMRYYPLILPGTEDQQVIVSDRWRYEATNQILDGTNKLELIYSR